jgi:hypothetical protein
MCFGKGDAAALDKNEGPVADEGHQSAACVPEGITALIKVTYFIKLVDFDPRDIVENWERTTLARKAGAPMWPTKY